MYKYRRYHPIFGNKQHGWFFTHMCGFYPTSEYIVDIWKKNHTCVVFTKHFKKFVLFGKNTHMWLLPHTWYFMYF